MTTESTTIAAVPLPQVGAPHSYLGPEWSLVWGTLILSAITLGLAIYTAKLYRATVSLSKSAEATGADQADKMERSIGEAARAASAMEALASATKTNAAKLEGVMHKQMRAYLVVDVGSAIYQDAHSAFGVLPMLTNSGFTPAHDMTYWASAEIFPFPLPSGMVLPEPTAPQKHSMVVGPRQSLQMNAFMGYRVEDVEVAAIKKGGARRLYIWGRASYKDTFGEDHVTEFCQSVTWAPPDKDGWERIFGNYDMSRNRTT